LKSLILKKVEMEDYWWLWWGRYILVE